ncbi:MULTISPECIES: aquaporin Z [unclassified Pseudoclavibacter]|uniref:aquaporin Z n=1 Tax=unclassified Pseudoclavibacter TaxID=2615177 RepID=UPI001300E33F|nr:MULTISPECIES: aquaporin Z [unclassified Pseudoclavibacter]KAB1647220.1 aquaporin Z [Pseudoclavibacter sp. CFCC 14310]KAB1657559.1 aquaporin Z [Pseudoclavibacter sp. CFCC 11306]KAB1662805.1 aquaporin Z [Pseudoclavibacter sp. CFCC 13611]
MSDTTTLPAPKLGNQLGAEFLGTFLLVFGGTGAAVLAATVDHGIGYLGVALAFGLTVVVGAYAFGPVSGGHFNPAVTIGLAAAGRFSWKHVLPYVAAQIVGGIVGSAVLLVIASGRAGFSLSDGFATNGYGAHSPEGYGMLPAFVIEFVLTAIFLYVIIGVTGKRAAAGFAPLAIGLTLALIHLISIPVTNTSVNPARSIAPAIFVGGDALVQLWLFILAPVLGAIFAGVTYALVTGERK